MSNNYDQSSLSLQQQQKQLQFQLRQLQTQLIQKIPFSQEQHQFIIHLQRQFEQIAKEPSASPEFLDPLQLQLIGNPLLRIGKYQIITTLGEGSFGKVKLAYHLKTGQRVALKIINRKTLSKSEMQGRVEREISYLRLLTHPHIIKLYDVIKSKDEIIMVIEFAGKELFEYIVQRGKMTESEARRFFQQIIAAVQYCHRHKIVHRDLKPENLLLDSKLNVKIADFGLSNIMTDGNFLKTSCGSPNYAAPEVISGKLYAGPEVDVWSCGVILYVMLCGRLPFDDEFIPALFKKISSGIFTIPPYLSDNAKNLLHKMLVVDPINRITTQEIMEHDWFKIDFPDYLKLNDSEKTKEIDDDIVKALAKTMGYDMDEVYDVLKNNIIGKNEIRDAYELMKENRTLVDDLKKKNNENLIHNNNNQTNNKQLTDSDDFNPKNSAVRILPTSIPRNHRIMMANSNDPSVIGKVNSRKTKPTRWHFGIRSKSYPLDVMGEIYRALKNLGAEWAKPNEDELWTIRVRWQYSPSLSNENNELETNKIIPDLMKMQIQLFQLEPNNYLVDFKFDGWESSANKDLTFNLDDDVSSFSAYPFLHLATRLIMELAVNSQGN
ncbi:carbon catabolite-derepressing protein kinase [Ascoidea rubescens DSM 1968]|uniref:Carbon catabolite-derepressing protein kinase n=1 Tax=Ascoidea rubescens DSM 1968 TaxID=1344418 RepID=A0A1D2VFM4_9ASCO|nr:carbon catabolite-derepressing protein kinase [Ascoidea rubescens DSM 1968]ODV60320.1 carbon catabolite-derepressing protein kinase [Ascoidea rubescens DSM 1968]